MAAGRLRAVVCTSSLDLGVDWGDIDLVINVGAPKGALAAAAAHRPRQPPARRAVARHPGAGQPLRGAGMQRRDRRGRRPRAGHAAAAHRRARRAGAARARRAPAASRSSPTNFIAEVRTAAPYAELARADFDAAVDFVATGGYALKATSASPRSGRPRTAAGASAIRCVAQRYRMNVGTIVEADMLKVRLVRSRAGGAGHTGPIARGGTRARRGRGVFHRDDGAGRHLRVRRRNPEIRGAGRGRGLRLAHQRDRPEGAGLRGRQVPAVDLSRRPRASAAGRAASNGRGCPTRCANGSASSNGARWCRGPRDLLVETFPRGDKLLTSSAIRSRAGSRTRRSACC